MLQPDPCAQVYQALLRAGASDLQARVLTAIAWAESGCRTDAVRRCPPDCVPGQAPEFSVGPFQINLYAHSQVSPECARDPVCAARYALKLPLDAWTAYRTGRYLASDWLGITVPYHLSSGMSDATRRAVVLAVATGLVLVSGAVLLRRR